MARPTTKEDLLKVAATQYEKLKLLIDEMTKEEQEQEFLFEDRDRNLRDVLAHLHEWHNMMEKWHQVGVIEKKKPIIPRKGYTWKTIPDMNIVIRDEYKDVSLEDIKERLAKSHDKQIKMIESHTNEELYTKNKYTWTTSTLGSFFTSATSSHYDWAMKKIKKQKKFLKEENKK